MKNKYFKRSHISEKKFREIIRLFAHDIPATIIASLTGISRPTVNSILQKVRYRLVAHCTAQSPLSGEVEVDESYFGAQRVRGKRGRGAYGKTIVFGLLKQCGKVYTEIVPNCSRATLQGVIRGRVRVDSVIHSDGWRGYDGLVDIGYEKHFPVQHGLDEFANKQSHINGIESFWSYSKRRLQKFNGVPKKTFDRHLKECEFRFNNRNEDLYQLLLKIIRMNPL